MHSYLTVFLLSLLYIWPAPSLSSVAGYMWQRGREVKLWVAGVTGLLSVVNFQRLLCYFVVLSSLIFNVFVCYCSL